MRDLAEQHVKQAHASYDQLTDVVTKAMDAWTDALPSNAITHGFKGVQERAVQIAKENAKSAFALAGKLAKAQNFPEVLTLQTQFAQDRTKASQRTRRNSSSWPEKCSRGQPAADLPLPIVLARQREHESASP